MTGLIHRSQSAGSSARVHSGNDRERARGGARPPALRPPPKGGSRECRWPERYLRLPARSPIAVADGDLWPGRDHRAEGQARYRGGQDNRVEEFGAARLPAANQASRFADCRRLSCRDQYARACRALSAVFGGAISKSLPREGGGYGEPRVAQGERRLGRLECPPAARGADHPLDPGWHRGAGSGSTGRRPRSCSWSCWVSAKMARRVLMAVKNMGGETSEAWRAVLDDLVKRGLRETEFLIVACPGEGRGRHWAGAGVGRPLGRRADPTLHGPQAPQPACSRTPAAA